MVLTLWAPVPLGTGAPTRVSDGAMTPAMADKFDDDDYPAYTMGRAAEMLGVTPAFLRSLGEAHLIVPLRSSGGHRRYSRYQLRLAARARELVDTEPPWKPPAASSSWKTNSARPCA